MGVVYATSNNLGNIVPRTVNLPQETVTLTQTTHQTQTVTQSGSVSTVTQSGSTVTQSGSNSASSSSSTSSLPTAAQETVQIPATVVQPVTTPTGWNTKWSVALGVQLIHQYNSSGPSLLGVQRLIQQSTLRTNGPGYSGYLSGLTTPGVCIIDALTYQVVVCRQYSIANQTVYAESHGLGVSMNGQWIYLPTGNSANPTSSAAQLFVINAQTLNLYQIIESPGSSIHHIQGFRLYNGTDAIMVQPFVVSVIGATGGATPITQNGGSFYVLTGATNQVEGGFPAYALPQSPYLAGVDPDGQQLFVSSRAATTGTGALFVIDMKTWTLTHTYNPASFGLVGSTPNMVITTAERTVHLRL